MSSKKVAVFTHFNVCNFGANMQALSTCFYLRKNGFEPVFINWTGYQKKLFGNVPEVQQKAHVDFIKNYLPVSPSFVSEKEIERYLQSQGITNVIVGSDAVLCLGTWLDRMHISRMGISVRPLSRDKIFPNIFWLPTLAEQSGHRIALMSVSSQNTAYQLLWSHRSKMAQYLRRYDYLSVRDVWTQKMVKALSGREAAVTPDPMWAFNDNAKGQLADDDSVLQRLNIKKPYLLLGFQTAYVKEAKAWLDAFISLAHASGYACVPLPFAFGYLKEADYDAEVNFPLSPLGWYRLIANSSGYVGYNMHPAIVCMHNNIPVFSIDNYGIDFKLAMVEQSSKIYDIFERTGIPDYRINIRRFFKDRAVSPGQVLEKIVNYDYAQGERFADRQLKSYKQMMTDITDIFSL